MRKYAKLSELQKYSSLSFTSHPSVYFDSSIKVSSPISRNTELLHIESFISGNTMNQIDPFKSSIQNRIFEYIAAINPDSPLISDRLRLFYQLSCIFREKSSLLHDYVQSLPQCNNIIPIYWKSLESTANPPLRKLISEEYLFYRNSFDKIFDLDRQVLSNISFQEYVWVNCLVKMHGSVIGNRLHVVPIFDTFLHSFDPNTEAVKDGNSVRVFTVKDLDSETVLTKNYGNMNNYEFLMSHGMVINENPYHRVPFHPENVPEWGKIVEKLGLTSKETLTKFSNSEGFSMSSLKQKLLKNFTEYGLADPGFSMKIPDKELEKTLKIVFLNETDMAELSIKDYKDLFSYDFSQPISQKNQRNVDVFLFKSSEMLYEIMSQSFNANHPLGRQIEDLDKSIVEGHLSHYKSKLIPKS